MTRERAGVWESLGFRFHRNGAPTVKELREKYLTPKERARAEEIEKQEF
jgi:hypothetical protein